jgi:hypothetical protein
MWQCKDTLKNNIVRIMADAEPSNACGSLITN